MPTSTLSTAPHKYILLHTIYVWILVGSNPPDSVLISHTLGMESDEQHLTIGSLVSIFVSGAHGFITAEQRSGPERLCALHQQSWKEADARVAGQLDPHELRPPGDFTRCVFQVRHQHQYSAHRRLLQQPSSDPSRVLHQLSADCDHERRVNADEFEAACSTPIKYGDVIQLAQPLGWRDGHPTSEEQECIGILRQAADCNAECGRVVVGANVGEAAWLRVKPALRTHSTGDRLRLHRFGDVVMGSDPIILEGVVSRLTLHSEPHLAFDDGQLEINGSLGGGSPLKLVLYRPFEKPAAEVLLCGQTVGLRASQLERGPFLQTDHEHAEGIESPVDDLADFAESYSASAKRQRTVTLNELGDDSEGSDADSDADSRLDNGGGGSEDAADDAPVRSPNGAYLKAALSESTRASSHSYWRLEDADSDGVEGGVLKQGAKVRLLHLATGRYLSVMAVQQEQRMARGVPLAASMCRSRNDLADEAAALANDLADTITSGISAATGAITGAITGAVTNLERGGKEIASGVATGVATGVGTLLAGVAAPLRRVGAAPSAAMGSSGQRSTISEGQPNGIESVPEESEEPSAPNSAPARSSGLTSSGLLGGPDLLGVGGELQVRVCCTRVTRLHTIPSLNQPQPSPPFCILPPSPPSPDRFLTQPATHGHQRTCSL